MQRKFVDPEHVKRQQIWRSAEKGNYSHTSFQSLTFTGRCRGEDKSQEPNEIAVKASCLPHTTQYAQEMKKSGDAM